MKPLLFSLSLLAITLHADDARVRNLENRVSALEQRKNVGGVILPSAGANIDDDVGVSFDAELLIWKAHQTGMNFASGDLTNTMTNPFLKPNFRFDPGVRASFGIRPEHDDWQLDAVWTYFYTKAKKNYEQPTNTLTPFFMTNENPSGYISSVWRVNWNMIDLELSRASFMSKWMSLKPVIAIRNTWLYQKYNISSAPSTTVYTSAMKSNLWAIGPKFGLEAKFGMGEGFYFFGNTAASLLWGFFKNSQATETQSGSSYTSIPRNIDIHTSTYNVDLALGLGWDKRFDDNHYRFSIRGAWEHHAFFNTNYFISDASLDTFKAFDTPYGNFTTEGFTLTLRFDF